ncbi:MAG TPA: hypothetical protein VFQ46_01785, partial [Candidatus Limnocylindria bacterium]|nr:hypothetical protein [Candidatus Limnocylindria bacterium]
MTGTLPPPELVARIPHAPAPESVLNLPWRATPRTLFLTGGIDGCLLWRVWWACAHISSHGFVADYVRYENLNDLYPMIRSGRYNTVVTPRFVWRETTAADEFIETVRRDGLCWIYELDDDVLSPEVIARQIALFPEGHPRGNAEHLEWERAERLRLIPYADGVSVSSPSLGQVVTGVTSGLPVRVIPNAIDVAWFRNVLQGAAPRVTKPVCIGWMGGQRNDDDLEVVGEAWGRIARRFPDVTFAIQGYPSRKLTEQVPPERLAILPWATIEEYPRALVNFDIACCSVSRDPWNERKTPIKWFEMSVAGVPCVVSNA